MVARRQLLGHKIYHISIISHRLTSQRQESEWRILPLSHLPPPSGMTVYRVSSLGTTDVLQFLTLTCFSVLLPCDGSWRIGVLGFFYSVSFLKLFCASADVLSTFFSYLMCSFLLLVTLLSVLLTFDLLQSARRKVSLTVLGSPPLCVILVYCLCYMCLSLSL